MSELITLRKKKSSKFYSVDLRIIEADSLSWAAKGVWTYLISRPDGWVVNRSDLLSKGKEKDSALRTIIKELEGVGLLKIERLKAPGGKFAPTVWVVSEEPDFPHVEEPQEEKPHVDFPHVDKPHVDEPRVGNQHDLQIPSYKYPLTNNQYTKDQKEKTPYIPQGGMSAEEKFFADAEEVENIDFETAGSMAKHFGLPFPESPLPKQPALKDLPKSSGRADTPGAFAPLPKHDPEGFREFWAQHPRKVGRQNAVRAWDKIKPSPETKGQIMHSLGWNKANNPQWTKDGGQFIPHPATWLNGLRWTDEQTVSLELQNRPMTTTEKNIKFLREYRQKHGLEA